MQTATVSPCQHVRGELQVPGDKSISHRAAMMAALAEGTSVLGGFLRAEDCLNTLKALAALGADVRFEGEELRIAGGAWRAPSAPLDMGNSGTGMRLMAGLLAGRPWTTELTGDQSLRSRPMGRIREPLERMGARIELTGSRGCAPMRIHGARLKAIDFVMRVASAQVKSCILMAGLFAEGVTKITEIAPTRDHTERMFLRLGLPLKVEGRSINLEGFGPRGPALAPVSGEIPGDFSSAAFWIAAASSLPGSRMSLKRVGLNPLRTGFLNVLRRMGASVDAREASGGNLIEVAGDIDVCGGGLSGVAIGGDVIPNVIDELPLIFVLGALAEGVTTVSGAQELRVKESDRIACMAANLRLLGIEAEEMEDGLKIRGPQRPRGGVAVDSHGDHRIAMAMAVLALSADSPVIVRDVDCVATSYPSFWEHLRSIGAEVKIDSIR